MFRFAQFLGSEGINVSLSSVDYDPYTQYNYLFKLDGDYVDNEISKKLDPEIQALEKLIQESTCTGQFTCVTAGAPNITIGGSAIAPTVAVNTACFSNCQGTVTSVCGGTGTTSSGGNTPAISLTDTGVSAGNYTSTNITVDAQGRITAASNGSGGGGGAGVANVTASHGLSSSGGTNPNITIVPAQTDITSIKNTTLSVGRDNDNLIKFNTDNQIVFEVQGNNGVIFKCGGEIEACRLVILDNVDISDNLKTDTLCLGGSLITRTAAQINDARPGTVTSVTAGNANITIGGTAAAPTVAVNSACFTDCEGTVTCVTAGTGLSATSGNSPVISIDSTQTTLSSIKNSCLIVGRDNANFIQFATNNEIAFKVANCSGVTFKTNGEIEAGSLDISGNVDIDDTLETNTLSIAGTVVDATAAEINQLHSITDGIVASNKAVIVDTNKDITGFRNITLTGELNAPSLDISGDVDIDGTLETDILSLDGTVITRTACQINDARPGTVTVVGISGTQGITVVSGSPITAGGTINLKVSDACNTKWNQSACNGTVTSITTTGAYLTGGTITCTGNIGLNYNCARSWDDKTTCTGTLTSVGCINDTIVISGTSIAPTLSVNDSCFSNCKGTVTSVNCGDPTITIGGTVTDPTIAVNTACFSNCEGTVESVALSGTQGIDIIDGSPITCSGTICLKVSDACNTKWNQSACNGTVTSITTTGAYLTGGPITCTGNIGINYNCAASWDAKTTCTGTLTSVACGDATISIGGTATAPTIAVNSSCFTNCEGTVTSVGGSNNTIVVSGTTTAPTLSVNELCFSNCQGTVTSVNCGDSTITIGGTVTDPTIAVNSSCFTKCEGTVESVALSGTQGIDIIDGSPITESGTICIKIDDTCNTAWNAKTTCTGTVTCVTGGDGLTGNITTSGSLAVDTSVARTNIDEVFSSDLTVQGDLTVKGDITCLETIISTTSALSVTNSGTGPALIVNQTGCNDIIDFRDDNTSVFYIEDGGNVGLGTTNPNYKLDVTGDINSQNHILSSGVNLDTLFLTEACNGTVTCIDVSGGICGGPITSSGTLSIDTACNTKWDQSACPGINATGTVCNLGDLGITAAACELNYTTNVTSDIQAQLNAKTDCCGTVQSVALSGTQGINIIAGSPITESGTICIKIDNCCNNAWNDKTTCTGTVESVAIGGTQGITVVNGSPITQCGQINLKITDACDTAWNANTTCTGTVQSITTTGVYLTGGTITCIGDIGLNYNCATSWDAKTTCTGTVNCLGDLGITATAQELNFTTNVTSDIQAQLDASCDKTTCTGTVCTLSDLGITTTAAKLNFSSNLCSDIQTQLNGKSPTAGSTGITTVGTIGTGCWQGTAIADAYIASASDWNACATSTQGTAADNALPKAGGTMTGNIVMGSDDITFTAGGTVDGRDVSADGSKLDGIACGAEVNVQSDFNATSGDALILNKPTIPTDNNELANGCNFTTCTGTVCSLGDLGITAPACAINFTTNVTSDIQAQLDAKGTGTVCSLGDLGITTTAAKLNCSSNVCADIQTQLNDKSPTAGSTGITTVGTIGTGVWQGTAIADAYIASASDWNACATSTQGTAADNALPKAGGDMAGNIVMGSNDITFTAGGTVDGRDVSADGNKLDGIACGAEVNVQSDFNATSGDALILNKPTIPTNNNQLTNGCNFTTCTGTVCSLGDLGITAPACAINYTTNVTSDIQAQLDASCSKTTCTGNICSSTAQCIYDSDENFCLGSNAGEDLTSGIRNTMLGKCAGRCITTGQNNIAIGFRAQEKNCEQNHNTALGFCSMFCGGGCGNAAIGQQAMQNSTADNSVAIGKCTLRSATGNSNVAIGSQALQNVSTGINNFGLGAIAGFGLSTGSSNVYIGDSASRFNTSGNNNIALGKCAGRCHSSGTKTSGDNSIYIGTDARAGSASAANEIVIGCGAVGQGTNTAIIGNSSTTNLYIHGCYSTVSDKRDKTCICDLELGLEFIKELKPKTFNTIADRCDPVGSITGKKHGFIAQDIIALEGEDNVIVSNKNPDRLSYTGEHIIPILVKGMQEQQLVIDSLVSEVEELKKRL